MSPLPAVTPTRTTTKEDPELGIVRWCPRCEMWQPDDQEFWIHDHRRAGSLYCHGPRRYTRRTGYTYIRCRSCFRERVNARRRERAA